MHSFRDMLKMTVDYWVDSVDRISVYSGGLVILLETSTMNKSKGTIPKILLIFLIFMLKLYKQSLYQQYKAYLCDTNIFAPLAM